MELKDVNKVLEDYDLQKNLNPSDDYDRGTISEFFGVESRVDRNIFNLSLANNVGEIAINELIDFITSEVFPISGDWVSPMISADSSVEDISLAKTLKEDLFQRVVSSNFYEEIGKVVQDGLLWGKGYLDARYDNGIYFFNYDGDTITLSESEAGKRRAYMECQMTLKELESLFKTPKSLMSVSAEKSTYPYTIVSCILPNTRTWFKNVKSRKEYIKVDILKEGKELLVPKNMSYEGNMSWPIHTYRPHFRKSLCEIAYTKVAYANYYEIISRNRASKINDPPIAADEENVRLNSIKLTPGSVVPIRPGGAPPQPIYHLTEGDQVNEQKIYALEAEIFNIMKTDLIRSLKAQGLSQYEYNLNYANVLKGLQPVFGGLVTGFIAEILMRCHSMLMENDSEYESKFKRLDVTFYSSGVQDRIRKAQELANIGMLGQAIGPFLQADPQAGATIDMMKIGAKAAISLGLEDCMKPAKQVAEELQARAESVDRQDALQETESMSSSISNLNKAGSQ